MPPAGDSPTAYEAVYCPRCGTETSTKVIDDAERCWCPDCDVVHWRAAVPVIGVAVVDDTAAGEDAVLAFYHDRTGLWDLPSGHQELPESAPETAARELREETNIAVDPAALELFDVTVKQHPLGRYNFSTTYRVDRTATTGDLEPEFPEDDLAWITTADARDRDEDFVPGVPSLVARALDT